MKKAIIGILAALFIASSVALWAACSKGEKSVTVEYATYESWNEGFSYLSIMDGFGRVSKSDEQKHGGRYSAKVQPLGSHTDPETKPYFYYPMYVEGDEGYDYSDFTYLNNIKFYMYNAESTEVSFEFCIIASVADIEGADCKAVQTVKLAPGKWTEVVYKPDYDALQNMCDVENIAGIGFRFDNCRSADIGAAPVLYIDDMTFSISKKANIEIVPSVPARGEIQSFDAASSLVYVNMDSGVDFAETWLPAGDAKLPEGVKGGVEFTISEAEIGTWPRLKFDSRTPQEELEKADYFSLLLYFDVPDESIDTIEIRMVPDTTDVYTEYVKANEWVELRIDTDIVINNWSTVIGVRSRGLFWVQNGLQGYCFNDIDAIRVADIKGVFNDVRVPAMQAGSVDKEYVLPEATLELNGTTVSAESWSYAVAYSDKAIYEAKYGPIVLENRAFTPKAGGTYIATYTAVYQGKTYIVEAEFEVSRAVATDGEIESFNDPSSVNNVRMESGRTYTATYLWAGDERLAGAEGAQGGVSFAIPSSGGAGSWPMFSVTPRVTQSNIEDKGEVSFWIYLGVEDESKLTAENKEVGIRVAIFPRPGSTGDVRVDEYVKANTWTKITVSAASFASSYKAVSVGNTGFFWVQNGAPADLIGEIRIANIVATGKKVVRPEAAANEIENFGDEGSADSLRIPNDVTDISWTDKAPGDVAAAYATIKQPYIDESGEKPETIEYYPAFTVTARRTAAEYRSQAASNGYNAVTLEIYLDPTNDGDAGKLARMNYWAQQDGMNDSQGTLKIGEWVTLTLDLDTFLAALENSEDDSVKLFWVHSTIDVPLETIYLRNVQLAKSDNILDLTSEGLLLLDGEVSVDYEYVTENVPDGKAGALKATFDNTEDSWPNLKFSADKNFLADSEALLISVYIEAGGADTVDAVMWPYGGRSADGVKLPAKQWITLAFEKDALFEVYNWSATQGVANTCLFWFTNTKQVSAVYVESIRAGSLPEKDAEFAASGISVSPSEQTMQENNDLGCMIAWFDINSANGYAYKLTITHNGETLVYGEDYTIGDKDGGLTLIDPDAGTYSLTFESYNGRYKTGTIDITVKAKDLSVSIGGGNTAATAVGEEFTFPASTLTNANDQSKVTWSYTVNGAAQTGSSFTPSATGEYTIVYIASYYGRTYQGTLTLTVNDYAISVGEPQAGKTGEEYTLPQAELHNGASKIEDVTFTYKVTDPNGENVQNVSADGKFTPSMAGGYKVVYTAVYNEITYEEQITVTIARQDAQADEIELFGDASSVDNVKLESGVDFEKTYLAKGDGRLPQDAEGGVSFIVTDGKAEEGNWPNLYFLSRMKDDSAMSAYDTVVIRLYIGVEDGYDAGKVQVVLKYSEGDKALYVKSETWTEIEIPVSEYLARNMSLTENYILFVHNGDVNTAFNEIDEVRIAGVYCKNSTARSDDMDGYGAITAWTGGNDALKPDSTYFGAYHDVTLAPEADKMPLDSNRVFRLYFDSGNEGTLEYRTTMTDNDITAWIAEGYKTLDVAFYVAASNAAAGSTVQITLYGNGSNIKIPVNTWTVVSFALQGVQDTLFFNEGDQAWQMKLFYMTVWDISVSDVWMSGFTVGNAERVDVVSFGDESAVSAFRTTDTGVTNASWVSADNLGMEDIASLPSDTAAAGAVKLEYSADSTARVHVASTIDKELYKIYSAKILVYIVSDAEAGQVNVKKLHNGDTFVVQETVNANEWIVIDVPSYNTEEGDNDLYDVADWFGGYTGWLNFDGGQGITAIYVAGVYLTAQA